MGSCVGGAGRDNVIRERRRLSASKADEGEKEFEPGPEDVRGSAFGKTCGEEGSILDLFPNADRKVSFCGTSADAQQKGFADKCAYLGGQETLAALRVGCTCKKGLQPESPNQDDFCIFNFDATAIYGVFDGHGPFGHNVANFVQEALPRCFVENPQFRSDPEGALNSAFSESHRRCVEFQAQGHYDCTLSGTTATVVVRRGNTLHVANVGHSRAVLALREKDGLGYEDLTVDHKPDCEGERRRIQSSGGQVRRLEGDLSHRVFLNGKMYPGLAMTRSIGDTIGVNAGIISEPTVRSVPILGNSRFVLVCSDGIWEFINSQEAVDIIGGFAAADVQHAVEALATEAWNRWIQEEGNIVDDITVICAWLTDED